MRRVKVLLCCAAALLLAACADLSMKIEVYATLDEARAAGAIEHGFVPADLPSDVSDLRLGHVDSGLWGAFSFPTSAAPAIHALLGEEVTGQRAYVDPPGRLEWWPPILRTSADPAIALTTGLHIYKAKSGPLHYAIHWPDGHAYYWKR